MEQSKLTGFDSFSVNTNLIANRQTKARERANKRSDRRQIAIISNVNFEWLYELFASEFGNPRDCIILIGKRSRKGNGGIRVALRKRCETMVTCRH